MSALDTAARVVEWATLAGETAPPQGDLFATEQLAHPPSPVRAALAQLAAITGARLRLGAPPLGDPAPVGVGALVSAAAVGFAAVPTAAGAVLRATPAARTPAEWVVRHGVVQPALPFLPPELAEDCRARSPLTALLDRPPPGQEDSALAVAKALRGHPAGRRMLVLQLARPVELYEVRRWRQDLLERLRLAEPEFVIDVYEAMMIYHEAAALAQAQAAEAVITSSLASADEARLRDALSVADWWSALWALERSDVDALRARRYLGYNYRKGIALYKLSQKLRGILP